ncbi:hypothetical protein [Pseudalkalibacillus caeni]|uniref:Uncharacterized protein n=1 Tax=Exobacillus caeni TaxID=2574798 RepID=A0A5R9F966_9BACL|nr:hypothetical protein [Pseudalkalibacillus caeni]TLS38158.1 hypothetical protein FCL54_06350 [Pseudalkalibacillus caeni]
MSDNKFSQQELEHLLNEWKGDNVIIQKEEMDDKDKTIMKLEDFSFQERDQTIDDYTSEMLLQLKGEGKVISDQSAEPLPFSRFEIPLEEVSQMHLDETSIQLKTERGSYTISHNTHS